MSYAISENKIVIKSKSANPFWKRLIATAFLCYMLFVIYMVIKTYKEGQDILSHIPEVCMFLAVFISLIIYVFLSYHEIVISTNDLDYSSAKRADGYKNNFNSISKILISDDNFIIYDTENNTDKVIDLEYFGHDEIQILINSICKKVPITINEDIAESRNIKLPKYAISQSVGSEARRRNINSNKTEGNNATEGQTTTRKGIITNSRRLELSENSQSEKKSDSKRRLEL